MLGSFSRIGGACLLGVTALFLQSASLSAEVVIDKTTTRVMVDQPIGQMNKKLAGVSLGGGATTYINPTYLSGMEGLGIRYVRLETVTADNRGLYNAQTQTYHWERLEQEIESMKGTGAEIIANVFYTPRSHAFHNDSTYFYSYPRDYAEWEEYVEAIVHHVNVVKGYNIKYWEIGNEPSGGHFFRAPMSEFSRYYAATVRAIKRADPTALVGGLGDNAQYPEHWRGLFDYCVENNVPVDFISYHWYGQWTRGGDTPPQLLYQYATALQGMGRETFGKNLPLLLTEWNLVGEEPDPTLSKVGAYLGAGLYWLQESPVEAAFYFRVQPHRQTMGSLLAADGQWRTLGRIFAMFSSMPQTRINLVSVHPGVVGLAAKDEDSLAVLLTRFDPDRNVSIVENKISLLEHGLSGQYRLRLYVEDSSTAAQLGSLVPVVDRVLMLDAQTPVDVVVDMENYSVVSLRLERVDTQANVQVLFSDAFALGSSRAVGGGIAGAVEQGTGAWKSFGGQSAVWGQGGGVVARNTNGFGYGSAEGRVADLNLAAVAGAGAESIVTLKGTFVLGSLNEWVAIGFLNGGAQDWWSQGKPLWVFLRPNGQISLSGQISSNNPAIPNPTYSIANVPGFGTDTPVEIAIVYNSATQGFNVLVNGVNTTSGWGMRLNAPLGTLASAAGFYINGSNGETAAGQIARALSVSLTAQSF